MGKLIVMLLMTLLVNLFGGTASTIKPIHDSTIMLFGDKNYRVIVHIFDTAELDESKNNATLSFVKIHGADTTRMLFDSLYCAYPDIKLVDFNNDGIKDVTVFHQSGARSNRTFYLYTVNPFKHSLTRVHGFEELPNPILDKQNNMITSMALSGKICYSFYRLDSQNKLEDIGHACEDDVGESKNYEKAIKEIRQSNNLINHKRKA